MLPIIVGVIPADIEAIPFDIALYAPAFMTLRILKVMTLNAIALTPFAITTNDTESSNANHTLIL